MENKIKTSEYESAYNYADKMDWFIDGDINVDYYDIVDLASDASYITGIDEEILIQAMIDYLKDELGYEI